MTRRHIDKPRARWAGARVKQFACLSLLPREVILGHIAPYCSLPDMERLSATDRELRDMWTTCEDRTATARVLAFRLAWSLRDFNEHALSSPHVCDGSNSDDGDKEENYIDLDLGTITRAIDGGWPLRTSSFDCATQHVQQSNKGHLALSEAPASDALSVLRVLCRPMHKPAIPVFCLEVLPEAIECTRRALVMFLTAACALMMLLVMAMAGLRILRASCRINPSQRSETSCSELGTITIFFLLSCACVAGAVLLDAHRLHALATHKRDLARQATKALCNRPLLSAAARGTTIRELLADKRR